MQATNKKLELPPHIRKALEREELKEAKKRKKQLKQLRQKESLKREEPPKEKIWYCLDDRTEYRETYDEYERHCVACLLCSKD